MSSGLRPFQWSETGTGQHLLVDVRDFVGRAAYFFGTLDPKIDWVCRTVLRPGDRCIDIGANVGQVTLLCARAVGPAGHVYSVEPQPAIAGMLRQSLQRNGLSNVTVHECALGEQTGAAWLHVPLDNSGMGSLSEVGCDSSRVKADVYAANEFLDALPPGIRLVKIDVEGHEEAILAGSGPFLSSSRPDCVVFECRDTRGFWARRGIQVLVNNHYDLFALVGTTRPRLQKLIRNRLLPADTHDVVALAPGVARQKALQNAIKR
jgi:FkbM family methyltransferase